jgi:alpha-beta hydrolase superfamily lysophospholipase
MAAELERLSVGEGAEARGIAVLRRRGRAPGLFWLGGYHSEMTGSKATAVDAYGESHGLAVTRFDYSGDGQSGGDPVAGTISRWLEEAQAVFETAVGPKVVIGSSMGAWLALLLARAQRASGRSRVHGLILIAPATDMTEALMRANLTKRDRKALEAHGYVDQPSGYGDATYRITQTFLDDGAKHLLFGHAIEVGCPVTILQGGKDRDVPREHAMKLVQHLVSDPVTFTLVPDGDHRLSRPQDLMLLETAITGLIEDGWHQIDAPRFTPG